MAVFKGIREQEWRREQDRTAQKEAEEEKMYSCHFPGQKFWRLGRTKEYKLWNQTTSSCLQLQQISGSKRGTGRSSQRVSEAGMNQESRAGSCPDCTTSQSASETGPAEPGLCTALGPMNISSTFSPYCCACLGSLKVELKQEWSY